MSSLAVLLGRNDRYGYRVRPASRTRLGLVLASLAVAVAACGSSGKPVRSATRTTTTSTSLSTSTTSSAPSPTGPTVTTTSNPKFGPILVTSTGRTLYTFSGDSASKITCTGACASAWPPYVLASGQTAPTAGPGLTGLGVVSRPDGSRQVTIHGLTLYTFSGDTAPGQANGNGITAFGGTWSVATPTSGIYASGRQTSTTAHPATTSTTSAPTTTTTRPTTTTTRPTTTTTKPPTTTTTAPTTTTTYGSGY